MDSIAVLLVCENIQDVMATQSLLGLERVDILHAISQSEAMEALAVSAPAVAILMSCSAHPRSLAEQLWQMEEGKHLPIIFIGPNTDAETEGHVACSGPVVEFLDPGIHPNVLRRKVSLFISLYQERKALEARHAAVVQARDFMIAELTHGLRSPIAAIALCAEKLKYEMRGNTAAQSSLAHLNASAKRLTRVIDQLPAFADATEDGVLGGRHHDDLDAFTGSEGRLRRLSGPAYQRSPVSMPLVAGDSAVPPSVVAVENVIHGS